MVQVRIFVRRKGMAGFVGGYWANISVGLHHQQVSVSRCKYDLE